MSSAGRPPGGPSRPSTTGPRRPSAAVYRRRRITVGVLALGLLAGLGLGATALARAVSGDAEPAPTASASPTPSPTTAAPTPGATPSLAPTDVAALPAEEPVPAASYTTKFEPEACRRGSLQVSQETSSSVYGVGGIVTFTLTVRNAGEVPCLVEGGSAALGVVVTSGADRVWASSDCPTGSTARPLLLDIGAQEVLRIPWDQMRSEPGCSATGTPVGPGTYQGSVTLDGGATTDSRTNVAFLVREA